MNDVGARQLYGLLGQLPLHAQPLLLGQSDICRFGRRLSDPLGHVKQPASDLALEYASDLGGLALDLLGLVLDALEPLGLVPDGLLLGPGEGLYHSPRVLVPLHPCTELLCPDAVYLALTRLAYHRRRVRAALQRVLLADDLAYAEQGDPRELPPLQLRLSASSNTLPDDRDASLSNGLDPDADLELALLDYVDPLARLPVPVQRLAPDWLQLLAVALQPLQLLPRPVLQEWQALEEPQSVVERPRLLLLHQPLQVLCLQHRHVHVFQAQRRLLPFRPSALPVAAQLPSCGALLLVQQLGQLDPSKLLHFLEEGVPLLLEVVEGKLVELRVL